MVLSNVKKFLKPHRLLLLSMAVFAVAIWLAMHILLDNLCLVPYCNQYDHFWLAWVLIPIMVVIAIFSIPILIAFGICHFLYMSFGYQDMTIWAWVMVKMYDIGFMNVREILSILISVFGGVIYGGIFYSIVSIPIKKMRK